MKKILRAVVNFLKGAVLGLANIIPGVSGGTMAVSMDCYDEYVETLGLRNIKKNLFFLLTAGAGMLASIIVFSIVASDLLESYPVASALTFVGLILGSLPLIFKHTRRAAKKLSFRHFLCFAVGLSVMVGMAFLNGEQTSPVYSLDFPHTVLLAAMMALSAFTMIIPGISGSLLMKVLGAYDTITFSIGTVSKGLIALLLGLFGAEVSDRGDLGYWTFLLAVIVGAACGLLLGSRLVSFLLKKFGGVTYSVILGLVLGSPIPIFRALWPLSFGTELYIGIGCLLVGGAVAYFFGRTEKD